MQISKSTVKDIEIYKYSNDCLWVTKQNLKCDLCNKKQPFIYCLKYNGNVRFTCCECLEMSIISIFVDYPEAENILCCGIHTELNNKIKKQIERNKMTYKLRYEILKRDKFQCVICSSNDRIEVDHIIPIDNGGKTIMENLRTLCFACNRGKSNKKE